MFMFLVIIILFVAVMWAIGGLAGGVISALSLRLNNEIVVNRSIFLWGWVKIFAIGGITYYVSSAIFSIIMDLLITGSHVWSLNIIPIIPAYFVTGFMIGSAGNKHMSSAIHSSSIEKSN